MNLDSSTNKILDMSPYTRGSKENDEDMIESCYHLKDRNDDRIRDRYNGLSKSSPIRCNKSRN